MRSGQPSYSPPPRPWGRPRRTRRPPRPPRARLVVTHGGTAAHPAVYDGHGRAVAGITVEASHVIVEHYRVTRPEAPGIEITGHDITVRNNTVTSPHGGDGDGMRFFGDHLCGNRTNPRVRYEVVIDASSRPGYRGPRPGGAP